MPLSETVLTSATLATCQQAIAETVTGKDGAFIERYQDVARYLCDKHSKENNCRIICKTTNAHDGDFRFEANGTNFLVFFKSGLLWARLPTQFARNEGFAFAADNRNHNAPQGPFQKTAGHALALTDESLKQIADQALTTQCRNITLATTSSTGTSPQPLRPLLRYPSDQELEDAVDALGPTNVPLDAILAYLEQRAPAAGYRDGWRQYAANKLDELAQNTEKAQNP